MKHLHTSDRFDFIIYMIDVRKDPTVKLMKFDLKKYRSRTVVLREIYTMSVRFSSPIICMNLSSGWVDQAQRKFNSSNLVSPQSMKFLTQSNPSSGRVELNLPKLHPLLPSGQQLLKRM